MKCQMNLQFWDEVSDELAILGNEEKTNRSAACDGLHDSFVRVQMA